jgi:hypothetical protein
MTVDGRLTSLDDALVNLWVRVPLCPLVPSLMCS